jgi:hypothetical protein
MGTYPFQSFKTIHEIDPPHTIAWECMGNAMEEIASGPWLNIFFF